MYQSLLHPQEQFDRYRITRYLAQGGMSDIYCAMDTQTGQEVVIKVPNPSLLGDPAQYERFQREMAVLGRLSHPAILRGLGSGVHERIPYLVTEYINGQSLREKMQNAPFTPEQALALFLPIAQAVSYCHEQGVIHRDLKPENILVDVNGRSVLMDFGLALTPGTRRVTYSRLSAVVGTPDYMSPEQIEGRRGDARSDVYALAILLFEMLAGKPPYSGDNPMAVMYQHLHATPPRLNALNRGVSAPLAAVIARGMARRPEERFASVSDFCAALQAPGNEASFPATEAGIGGENPLSAEGAASVFIGLAVLLGFILLALFLQNGR